LESQAQSNAFASALLMKGSVMSIRRIGFLAVVLLALMAVAVPAAAVPPTTESFEFTEEFVDESVALSSVDL
jgi:hypothetical protein